MQIDKQQIIQKLEQDGEHELAKKAKEELPAIVDHEEHSGLLKGLGLNPQELVGKS